MHLCTHLSPTHYCGQEAYRVHCFRAIDGCASEGGWRDADGLTGFSVPVHKLAVPCHVSCIPVVKVGHHLDLVNKLVLPQAAEHHGSKQPLWVVESRGAPKVRSVNVEGHCLARELDNVVELDAQAGDM